VTRQLEGFDDNQPIKKALFRRLQLLALEADGRAFPASRTLPTFLRCVTFEVPRGSPELWLASQTGDDEDPERD
jgi:hypothetical protein